MQRFDKKQAASSARQFLSAGLSLLRGVTGDDAYEKYVAHMLRTQPEAKQMTATEFFRAQLDQKWNCVSGCC